VGDSARIVPVRRHPQRGRTAVALTLTWCVAVSYGALFVLILYCDLNRPEEFGAELNAAPGGLIVRRLEPGGPAARSGLLPGDRIVSAEGRPLRGALDWIAIVANVEFDRPVTLAFERQGIHGRAAAVFHPVSPAFWRSPPGVSLVVVRAVQLATLLLAIAIAVRPTGITEQFGALFLATIGVFCLALPYRFASVWRALPLAVGWLFWLPMMSTLVVGGTLWAFFASFPRPRFTLPRLLLLCCPLVAALLWQATFLHALVNRFGDLSAIPDVTRWIVVINAIYVAAGLVVLLRTYRTLTDANERRRVQVVLTGSCIGCTAGAAPFLAYWTGLDTNLSAMYASSPFVLLASILFLAMPLSFWYASVRHQLFDLRLVARGGLRYAFARGALLASGPLVIAMMALDGVWHQQDSIGELARRHVGWYALALVAFGAFHVWRAPCLDFLDRRLFRDRYNACMVLRAVVSTVRGAGALGDVATPIVEQIETALHPYWVALFVRAQDDEFFHAVAGTPAPVAPWPARTRLVDFVRALQRPLDVDVPEADWVVDRLPDAEVDALGDTGAHLFVPVVMSASGPEAMLVLGRKRSDEPFGREDKDLLQAIAESVAPLVDPHVVSHVGVPAGRQAHAGASNVGIEDERLILETSPTSTVADTVPSDEGAIAPHVSTRWGQFELREQVGSGSFGTVYRAWDPKLDREVAVKLLRHTTAWLDEGRLLARVRHPNVVTVYGANEFDGRTGLWMEFVRGKTIKGLIETQGVFGGHEAALVGGVMCRALAAVHHAGLLHQDIKAQNVMRERGGRLVLMDFGAGVLSRDALVPSGGTPIYMAPELFGDTPASAQSDLYAVGVLLFHMTTAAFPVDGRTYADIRNEHARGIRHKWLRDLRPDLPDRFVAVVERALDADPSRRFASAGAMEQALAAGDW
jgi:hypothetical protein